MDEIIKELENRFKDVTDVSDPASMDLILMRLEETRREDEEYMELLVKKLRNEIVNWEQPPYQTNYRLTRKPHPEESEQCETGHFTYAERKMVEKNWDSFVREYKVPDKPVCLARWRNRDKVRNSLCPEEHVRNFVTAYLARGLQRNLYQVNRYFTSNYAYPVKLQNYTPTEEKIMEICFLHNPNKAAPLLSEVLGREPRGINKRYSEYVKGKPERKPKLKWTLKLAAQFIQHLMEFSGCTFKELKYNPFSHNVWLQVAQAMGQQCVYLRQVWFSKLHVQLFVRCTIKLKSLRRIICKILESSPYEIWSDIRWKEVVKEFPDGFTDMFLFIVAKRLFRKYADYRTARLHKLLARLREDRNKWQLRRLKSLKFHRNGNLEYVTHDISLKKLLVQMSLN